MRFQVLNQSGEPLDAHFDFEGRSLFFRSRGGSRKSGNAENTDYKEGLTALLVRLKDSDLGLEGVWVETRATRSLSTGERLVLSAAEFNDTNAEALVPLVSPRVKRVGRLPQARKGSGNDTKRLRLTLSKVPSRMEIAEVLGAVEVEASKDAGTRRLPDFQLQRVGSDHIRNAILKLLSEEVEHPFGKSTNYDVIVDEGKRLPPKAVFGLAATEALGFEVLPHHFSAGEGHPCFRIIRRAGYEIVKKNGAEAPTSHPPSITDVEWREGGKRLAVHLVSERQRGLAPAKKDAFLREHGKLFCERCGFDPVANYGEEFGEAAIEVHHSRVQVRDMTDGHITRLEDLECLCANCHRVTHREIAAMG